MCCLWCIQERWLFTVNSWNGCYVDSANVTQNVDENAIHDILRDQTRRLSLVFTGKTADICDSVFVFPTIILISCWTENKSVSFDSFDDEEVIRYRCEISR